MNVLDVLLIVLVIAYGVSGYWQGFIAGATATLGLLLGLALGIAVVPVLLNSDGSSLFVSLGALFIVLLVASLGQALGAYMGAHIRDQVTWRPVRSIDAVGGAVLSMVAVLAVAWALGYAVSGARIPLLADSVRSSKVLAAVDEVMPDSADRVLSAFNTVVDSNLFPRYLEPFVPEEIVEVAPPNGRVVGLPGVRDAADSVVKVLGEAECGRGVEGSGFVYGDGRVMTNAHVVAGVADPVVVVGERRLPATTVLYDAQLDVAVLAVDDLGVGALDFDRTADRGDPAAVLGYPQNGPYSAVPARIRSQQQMRSPDIYQEDTVVRTVYAVRAEVQSGNSGGPLVAPNGDVLGVVFAASLSDPSTGYVLTAEQVAADAAAGEQRSDEVSTGDCA